MMLPKGHLKNAVRLAFTLTITHVTHRVVKDCLHRGKIVKMKSLKVKKVLNFLVQKISTAQNYIITSDLRAVLWSQIAWQQMFRKL